MCCNNSNVFYIVMAVMWLVECKNFGMEKKNYAGSENHSPH